MIEISGGGVRRRRDKRWVFVVFGAFIAVFLFSFLAEKFSALEDEVGAANVAAFDPGYIISDYQMGRYDAMSEAEIQTFLKSKNACNDTNLSKYTFGAKVDYYSETAPYTWHVDKGHFVCMADEVIKSETAAKIIHQAAQDYRINPQVLIVLLQKEQGLVTDTFPNSIQYRSATGYGCPDTAACDAKYYGFRNQVRKAAELFRTVLDGGWTNYPLGENYVQYNPSRSCGGSVVNIRNLATSALYRYTPYQPNAAILAGWNDGCAAYGNLNFYKYFEDWFSGITTEEQVSESRNRVPADVKEGVYIITTAINGVNVIDITGGAEVSRDGTNIQVWEENNTDAQKWNIIKNDDLTYTLINLVTEKVLDVAGGSKKEGANVQLWENNGTCAQKWRIEKDGDYYIFISSCSGLVLDVEGGSSKNGANIQIWSSNGTDAQGWLLSEVEGVKKSEEMEPEIDENKIDGIYSIHPMFDTEKALDVENGSFADMSNVQIYTFWDGNAAQEWEIKKNEEEDYYVIKNAHSHKALDVAGGILGNNTNIWTYSENDTCAQKWKLLLQGDDSYKIMNACEEKMVLDVQDYYENVQLYTGWGENNSAQKWKLNKIR